MQPQLFMGGPPYSKQGANPMTVYKLVADYREKKSRLVHCLCQMGIEPTFSRLDVGDYVVSNSVAIERKTSSDLVSSVLDGRFQDQLGRLKEAYPVSIVLIIGGLSKAAAIAPNAGIIYSLIAKAVLGRVNFVVFEEYVQAAEFIKWLVTETSGRSSGYDPLIKRKPKGIETAEQVYNVLTSLPGVGPVSARRLVGSFGALSNIFSSSESQLATVLGPAKARKLIHLLRSTITQSERNTSLTDFMSDNTG
jgi:ERCC4-type nuclease